jgi:hypothetical protein
MVAVSWSIKKKSLPLGASAARVASAGAPANVAGTENRFAPEFAVPSVAAQISTPVGAATVQATRPLPIATFAAVPGLDALSTRVFPPASGDCATTCVTRSDQATLTPSVCSSKSRTFSSDASARIQKSSDPIHRGSRSPHGKSHGRPPLIASGGSGLKSPRAPPRASRPTAGGSCGCSTGQALLGEVHRQPRHNPNALRG